MKKPNNVTPNDWQLIQKKYRNIKWVLKKIAHNYPIQYLIGHVNFYGNKIMVNKNVLIPRYETETLIAKTLEYLDALNLVPESALEIGTGSGCISITLKKQKPIVEITAIEISRKALKLAKKNAKYNKCKINFIKKDMFKYHPFNKYDILISNPPYIREKDIIDPQTSFEPNLALYGGKDGLKYYEQIFKIAKSSLKPKHLIALEIGEEQGKALKKLAKKHFPKDVIKIEKDLPGKDRYLFVYNKTSE